MVSRSALCESELKQPSFTYDNENFAEETSSIASSTSVDEEDMGYNSGVVVADGVNKCKSLFGSITATNCNDVHFGNKTFYHGPVTIKQFLYPNNNSQLTNSASEISDNDSVFKICGLKHDVDGPNDIHKTRLTSADNKDSNSNTDVNNDNKFNSSDSQVKQNKKGNGWFLNLSRQHVIFIISLLIVLVTSLVVSTVVLVTRNPVITEDMEEREEDPKGVGKSPEDRNFTLPPKLKMIPRAEWLAQPPTEPLNPLTLPVPYVIIWHTATETCTDEPTCIYHVRHVQMYDVESRKFLDIGYNFLVGGDGFAYEGRGWKSEGVHTYGYNINSIGIALIGTFTKVLPTQRQIKATKQLIEQGLNLGYIAKDYKLFGACQLESTESPGKKFFEKLKMWDHWAARP